MTLIVGGGFHGDDSAEALFSQKLIVSVGAGGFLTRVNVQGYAIIALAQAQYDLSGRFVVYNLAAGLSWGIPGFGGGAITTGGPAGFSWVSFGDLLPATQQHQDIPGVSPQSFMQEVAYGIDIRWRGNLPMPGGGDVYMEVGQDQSRAYTGLFRAFYTFYTEWAEGPS